MVNELAAVERNVHKSYLLDLAAAGVPMPVTRLLRAGAAVDEGDVGSTFAGGPVVVKPAVGAGGRRTEPDLFLRHYPPHGGSRARP